MLAWFAKSPIASALRTFVAVVIAAAVGDWASGGAISLAHWQTWVISALVSAIPPILRWLNPDDSMGQK